MGLKLIVIESSCQIDPGSNRWLDKYLVLVFFLKFRNGKQNLDGFRIFKI